MFQSPWSLLEKLVKMILDEGFEALVVYPDWPRRLLYKQLQDIAAGVFHLQAEVLLFALKDRKVGPTKCGLHQEARM